MSSVVIVMQDHLEQMLTNIRGMVLVQRESTIKNEQGC